MASSFHIPPQPDLAALVADADARGLSEVHLDPGVYMSSGRIELPANMRIIGA